jgi:hypothetical protein
MAKVSAPETKSSLKFPEAIRLVPAAGLIPTTPIFGLGPENGGKRGDSNRYCSLARRFNSGPGSECPELNQ